MEIKIGIIGLGMMGKEFASAIARWCNLSISDIRPVITGICSRNKENWNWYLDHFPSIKIKTDN
jgi:predicted dehydrogenase